MAFRRFKTSWRHRNADGADIVYPAGWAGEMDVTAAAEADKAGVTVTPETVTAAEPQVKAK